MWTVKDDDRSQLSTVVGSEETLVVIGCCCRNHCCIFRTLDIPPSSLSRLESTLHTRFAIDFFLVIFTTMISTIE